MTILQTAQSKKQQADFIDSMMNVFYVNKAKVDGINYFALGTGTTEIIDSKGKAKLAYEVIKKYYSPATVSGTITDELGKKLSNIKVSTSDQKSNAVTGHDGKFSLVVPAQNTSISVNNIKYYTKSSNINLTYNLKSELNIAITPINPSWLYHFRLWLKSMFVS